MRKKIRYKNIRGMSLCFGDKRPYYLEKIDATSLSGVFSADSFARFPGQVTNFRNVNARSVVCDFAIQITDRDKSIIEDVIALFNPLLPGVLTIDTDSGTYEIDCCPSAVPSILPDDKVPSVYRFSIDFVCDYPYFRKPVPITEKIFQAETKIYSYSSVDTPLKIHFPAGGIFTNRTTGQGFSISPASDGVGVTVDTKNFAITDDNGNDVSNLISIADDIGDVYLQQGWNAIFCVCDVLPVTISYDILVQGVI